MSSQKNWFPVTRMLFFNILDPWAVNSQNFKSILKLLPTAFHECGMDHFKTRKLNFVKEVEQVKSGQAFVPFEPIQTLTLCKTLASTSLQDLLTKLTQGVFSVTNNDPVGMILFACEVIERLQGHLAIPLQDLKRLLTVTPCIGSRSIKERSQNGLTYSFVKESLGNTKYLCLYTLHSNKLQPYRRCSFETNRGHFFSI